MVAYFHNFRDPATKDRAGEQEHDFLVLSTQADIRVMTAPLLELFLQDLISDNDLDPSFPVVFDIVSDNARVRSEARPFPFLHAQEKPIKERRDRWQRSLQQRSDSCLHAVPPRRDSLVPSIISPRGRTQVNIMWSSNDVSLQSYKCANLSPPQRHSADSSCNRGSTEHLRGWGDKIERVSRVETRKLVSYASDVVDSPVTRRSSSDTVLTVPKRFESPYIPQTRMKRAYSLNASRTSSGHDAQSFKKQAVSPLGFALLDQLPPLLFPKSA
jgi:hypothetical protein